MRVFFDSSALAKRYVREPGTDRVLARCIEAQEVVLCVVAVTELVSAFNRLRREGTLDDAHYANLKSELVDDLTEASLIDLTPHVIALAVDALERFTLRALDALHLGAAVAARVDLFVSADRRQCQAARSLHLAVDEVTEP